MDHDFAVTSRAVERYLLQEMEEAERDAFETHYFTCPMCAEDLKAADVLVRNAASVFADGLTPASEALEETPRKLWGGWSSWWPAALGHPAFAMALAALAIVPWVTGVPARRARGAADGPQAVPAAFLRAESRGDAVKLHAVGAGQFLLVLDVNAPEGATQLNAVLRNTGKGKEEVFPVPVPPAGDSLHILVPAASLPRGEYMLLLMAPASGSTPEVEVGRYRFEVQ